MLPKTSPDPMPEKAYTNLSKAAMKAAAVEPSMDAELNNDAPANAESADSSSEMVVKPFEDLSNPQGYMLFSPF